MWVDKYYAPFKRPVQYFTLRPVSFFSKEIRKLYLRHVDVDRGNDKTSKNILKIREKNKKIWRHADESRRYEMYFQRNTDILLSK